MTRPKGNDEPISFTKQGLLRALKEDDAMKALRERFYRRCSKRRMDQPLHAAKGERTSGRFG